MAYIASFARNGYFISLFAAFLLLGSVYTWESCFYFTGCLSVFFVGFLPPHRSPNGPGLVEWPRYDRKENYLKLNLQPTVGRGLKQNRAHFLDVVLPDKLAKSHPANDGLWPETSIKCNIHNHTKSEEDTEFHCLLSASLYLDVVLADWVDLPVWMFDLICAGTFKYRLWWPSPSHLEKQRCAMLKSVCLPSIFTVGNMAEYEHMKSTWYVVPEVWGHVAHCELF